MLIYLLHVVGPLVVALDFAVWLCTLGPLWMALRNLKHRTVRAKVIGRIDVNGTAPSGERMAPSEIWRHYQAAEEGKLVERPFIGEDPPVRTVWDLVCRAYRRFPTRNALGTRTLLEFKKLRSDDKFPTKIFGPTEWATYAQVEEQVLRFGSALIGLGMAPQTFAREERYEDQPGPHTVLLYEETCAEWFIAAQGAHSQSIAVATAYGTLGVESVTQAVEEGNVVTILCNRRNVQRLVEYKAKGHMASLRNIIYTDLNIPAAERQRQPPLDGRGIRIYSFEELLRSSAVHGATPPQAHHCAVLMYTSGSTGKPKGIVCLHSQLVSMMSALEQHVGIGEGETLVGYLPLAHIFEMQMEFFTFGYGGCIGYADPRSLTGGAQKCMMQAPSGQLVPRGALEEFRPTIMGAVPKVWEVIKSGAEAKVQAGGAAKLFLFNLALSVKQRAMPQGRYCPVFDRLVFAKFKGILGGRLRLAVSGGGAISESVQSWVRAVFGCPLVQGYGLTETCAGLTVQMPDDWRLGVAGSPLPTCDVLVASCPDVSDMAGRPYLADDTDHMGMEVRGRGEVWTRGNNVTRGYYKMPQQTAEAWTEDGWFKTGDIAVMLPDGSVKIVDRKKNLAKLKGGEYVALEKMNLALKTADIVNKDNGGVCVIADDSLDRPVALVQVDTAKILELADRLRVEGKVPDLCRNTVMRDAVLQQLNEAGKAQGLTSPLEKLAAVALLHDEEAWTPENGCLTATQKLVPNRIKVHSMVHVAELKLKCSRR